MTKKFDPHGEKLALDVSMCPMCMSTFDSRKFTLVTCSECGAEGCTASCMAEKNPVCSVCEDDS